MLGANWDSLECRFEPLNANNSPESANRWVREVDYIVGCALFLSRSSFERVGGFDEDFSFIMKRLIGVSAQGGWDFEVL